MVTPQQYRLVIQKLPPLMKQVLRNESMTATNMVMEDVFKLKPAQGDAMMVIIQDLIAREITPAQIRGRVDLDLKLPPNVAAAFTRELLGRVVLPMEWYVGNVEGLIRELGGQPEEYLRQAQEFFPEVYAHTPTARPVTPSAPAITPNPTPEVQPILANLEERLTTFKGRAEILLRLTALSQHVEAVAAKKLIDQKRSQELIQALDALSYAVNTQDLNPLEVQAVKRRLTKVVNDIGQLPA
ncbi:MAG: hypothetical protein HY975_04635 [Candidatus Kerfeldbacteria bacterium]|nr:hypothetical protein [Candidatus Kerfeldbacteria bacterium]